MTDLHNNSPQQAEDQRIGLLQEVIYWLSQPEVQEDPAARDLASRSGDLLSEAPPPGNAYPLQEKRRNRFLPPPQAGGGRRKGESTDRRRDRRSFWGLALSPLPLPRALSPLPVYRYPSPAPPRRCRHPWRHMTFGQHARSIGGPGPFGMPFPGSPRPLKGQRLYARRRSWRRSQTCLLRMCLQHQLLQPPLCPRRRLSSLTRSSCLRFLQLPPLGPRQPLLQLPSPLCLRGPTLQSPPPSVGDRASQRMGRNGIQKQTVCLDRQEPLR
ncbi:uncharacterized protein [Paramormyrops kingsleyae]|uniref:uncharacterized protein n=1 Tax=Paramormyrops kingsleyae TaxID=1676925 RepID=UPI003B97847D